MDINQVMALNQSHENFSLGLASPSGPDGANLDGNVSADSEYVDNTEVNCSNVTFIIYVPIFGTICLLGLLGNTFSIVVLQWEKRNKVATFLLQALALADNLFLLVSGFSQIFAALCLYNSWDEAHQAAIPYIRVFIWPLVAVTQFGTVWMTVLIAANRYVAICRPFQAHKLCSMFWVRVQIAAVVVSAVLYNIPKFFEFKLTSVRNEENNRTYIDGTETDLLSSNVYNILYLNAMYSVFVFLVPLCFLLILNVCIIRELFAARQRFLKRQIPIAGEEEENNITLVMIIIMAIFFFTQTPAFVNALVFTLNANAYVCGEAYFYFYHISNLLVCLNSSTNFVVYCLFRKQFRERIVNFCNRRKNRFLLKPTDSMRQNGTTISMYSSAETNTNTKAEVV